MGNMGSMTTVWKWEITLADKGEVYKGKAIVLDRKVELPWTELLSNQPLTEMIDACKRYMEQQ